MSEQESKPTAAVSAPAAPAVDVNAIQAQAIEAARAAALEAAQETKTATEQMLAAHRQQVARAYGFEKEEDEVNPALRLLLSNPQESLGYVKDVAKQEAMQEIRRELAEARATENTVSRVFGARPDITADPMNIAVVRGFLEQTDPALPLEERLSYATSQYDRYMDSRLGTTMQQRIAAAATVPGASGQRGAVTQEQAQQNERASWEQERSELLARRNAQRNLF